MKTQSGYTSTFVQGKHGEDGKDASLTYYGTYMSVIGDLDSSTKITDLYIDGSCVGTVYYKNTQREPTVGDYCIYTASDSEVILYEVTNIDISTLCTSVREIDSFIVTNNIETDSENDLNVSIIFETFDKSYTIYQKNMNFDTTNITNWAEPTVNNINLDVFLHGNYSHTPPNVITTNEHRALFNTFTNSWSGHSYHGTEIIATDFKMFKTTTESNKFIRAYTLTLNNTYNKKYKVILDFIHKNETAQNTSNICSMFNNVESSATSSYIPNCIPTCCGNMYSYEINRNYNNENLQSFTITLKDWDDGDNYEHDVNVKDFFIYKGTVNDENYDCYAYIMIEEVNGISQKYLIGKIDSINSLGLKIPTE